MPDFETKDSGQHEQYASGMRRDTNAGKPRFDLIRTKRQPYDEQMITRYANLLARGAAKYDPRNWEEGDSEEELDRAKESLLRHTEQLIAGETDEDHAAAVWFNTQAVEYFRWRIEQKKKSPEMTLDFKFDADADGKHLIELMTGGVITQFKGDLKQTSLDPWPEAKLTPFVRVDDEDEVTVAKAKHRAMINDWHNRPTEDDLIIRGPIKLKPSTPVWAIDGTFSSEPIILAGPGRAPKLKPGSPATPEDREVAARMIDHMQEIKRLNEWMVEYGDEIMDFDGFAGLDTYTEITRREYLAGLPMCTMKYNFSRHREIDGQENVTLGLKGLDDPPSFD